MPLHFLNGRDAAAALQAVGVLVGPVLSTSVVLKCSVILLVLGTLCASAGIGGGGIVVAVLMNFGQLSPHDSVPVSKAVVFIGAVVSFTMNAGKQFHRPSSHGGPSRASSLIEWEICKLVVPLAMVGTLLGVLFNRAIPGWCIAFILVIVLANMAYLALAKSWNDYHSRQLEPWKEEPHHHSSEADAAIPWEEDDCENSTLLPSCQDMNQAVHSSQLSWLDCLNVSVMMIFTVVGGVFRHGAEQCMEDNIRCLDLALLALVVPVTICLAMALHYSNAAISKGWAIQTVAFYQTLALVAGILSGLVGIGGGLIFAPAFLSLGVEPAVAVATSSTCVLCTSCSTSAQYFLMGRIQLPLAIVYGTANAVASMLGTKLVHRLQDRLSSTRWVISAIVAAAVVLSVVLSMVKVYEQYSGPSVRSFIGHV